MRFGLGIVNKGNFRLGYTHANQLCFQIVVHIELSVAMRCGKVTEHELRRFLLTAAFPYPVNVIETQIDLAFRVVGQQVIG